MSAFAYEGLHGLEFVGTQALVKALHKDANGLKETIGMMGSFEQRELARACDRLKNELWYTLSKEEAKDE